MPMNRKEYRANGGTTEPETQIDPSTVFSTFGKDQLANIHRHYWKERLKISKLAKDESNMLEASEDIALQSCDILQPFVWWGHKLASHHTNVCKIS